MSVWLILTMHDGMNTNPFTNDEQYHGYIINVVENTINSGDLKLLNYLLNHGLDINYQSQEGYTLLHLAVMAGQSEMEKALIAQGAQLNIRSNDGTTPLSCAYMRGDIKSVTILMNANTKEGTFIPPASQ